MNPHHYCVIMAGGIGSRFWPISRVSKPKQFLNFGGQKSFLKMTYDRFSGIIPHENIVVVTYRVWCKLILQIKRKVYISAESFFTVLRIF